MKNTSRRAFVLVVLSLPTHEMKTTSFETRKLFGSIKNSLLLNFYCSARQCLKEKLVYIFQVIDTKKSFILLGETELGT